MISALILHVGEDVVVLSREVVAILDLSSSLSPDTQGFLQMAEEEGFVRNVGPGDFKSVVICQSGNRTRVYYSPISSKTLWLRGALGDSQAFLRP